jgi:hypothetical protein
MPHAINQMSNPTSKQEKSGLYRNASTTSNSDHAIKLRVQPHVGHGTPVSLRNTH